MIIAEETHCGPTVWYNFEQMSLLLLLVGALEQRFSTRGSRPRSGSLSCFDCVVASWAVSGSFICFVLFVFSKKGF